MAIITHIGLPSVVADDWHSIGILSYGGKWGNLGSGGGWARNEGKCEHGKSPVGVVIVGLYPAGGGYGSIWDGGGGGVVAAGVAGCCQGRWEGDNSDTGAHCRALWLPENWERLRPRRGRRGELGLSLLPWHEGKGGVREQMKWVSRVGELAIIRFH